MNKKEVNLLSVAVVDEIERREIKRKERDARRHRRKQMQRLQNILACVDREYKNWGRWRNNEQEGT